MGKGQPEMQANLWRDQELELSRVQKDLRGESFATASAASNTGIYLNKVLLLDYDEWR